jgi:hypothetical protein
MTTHYSGCSRDEECCSGARVRRLEVIIARPRVPYYTAVRESLLVRVTRTLHVGTRLSHRSTSIFLFSFSAPPSGMPSYPLVILCVVGGHRHTRRTVQFFGLVNLLDHKTFSIWGRASNRFFFTLPCEPCTAQPTWSTVPSPRHAARAVSFASRLLRQVASRLGSGG